VDLLTIDEANGVFDAHQRGGRSGMDCYESTKNLAHLELVVRAAKRVIVCDADLRPEVWAWFCRVRSTHPQNRQTVIELSADAKQKLNPFTYALMPTDAAWDDQLVEAVKAGKKVAVATGSRAKADSLGLLLQAEAPNATQIILTGENALDQITGIDDIDAWLVNHAPQVFIYTPVIGSGVSIDKYIFDAVYAYCPSNTLTAQAFDQLIHRVRNPNDKTMTLRTAPGGNLTPICNHKKIRADLSAFWAKGKKEYEATIPTPLGDVPTNEAHCELYCHYKANQHQWGGFGGNISAAFRRFLAQEGRSWYEVDVDAQPASPTIEAVAKASKAAKIESKASRAREIANAPQWNLLSKEEPKTNMDVRAIQKAVLADFYQKDVTEALVLADKEGHRRSQAKHWARQKGLLTQFDKVNLKLLEEDHSQAKYGTLSHIEFEHANAKVRKKALRMLGLDMDVLFANNKKALDLDLDGQKVAEVGAWVGKHRQMLVSLGVGVGEGDPKKNPMKFVGNLLKTMGFKVASSRTTNPNGTRGRKYWVTAESITSIATDACAYYKKLIDSPTAAMTKELEAAQEQERVVEAMFACP
jgi:hypothetical protein